MRKHAVLNQFPFLRLIIPPLAGVGIAAYLNFTAKPGHMLLLYGFLLALGVMVVLLHLTIKRLNGIKLILLFMLLFVCGVLLFSTHNANTFKELPIGSENYVFYIEEVKAINDHLVMYTVRARADNNGAPWIKATVYHSPDGLPLHPGHVVYAGLQLRRVKNRGNPGEFDYQSYLSRRHIWYSGWITTCQVVDEIKHFHYRLWVMKNGIKSIYSRAGLSAQNAALLFALTSGDKSLISREQKSAFADSGVMHILAVSGLHVGILYLMACFLLTPLNRTRRGKLISLICIASLLIFYAFFTGLSPSVVRAVTMFILIDMARLLNKNRLIINAICLSAFVILFVDPHYALEPGFWLSYGAVISIVLIMRLFEPFLREKHTVVKRLWEIGLVTLAAQPGTFPLVLYWFKKFPVYFFITNVLILPLVGLLLIYNFFILAVGSLGVPLETIGKPLVWMLDYINFIPLKIASIPGSTINGISINLTEVVLLYLLSGLVIQLFYAKNLNILKPISCVAILLIMNTGYTRIKRNRMDETIIFNHKGNPVLVERRGNECTIYGTDTIAPVSDYISFAEIKKSRKASLQKFVFSSGKLFHFVDNKVDPYLNLNVPKIAVMSCSPEFVDSLYLHVQKCVIGVDCNSYDRNEIKTWCKHYAIPCHDLHEQGAFVFRP